MAPRYFSTRAVARTAVWGVAGIMLLAACGDDSQSVISAAPTETASATTDASSATPSVDTAPPVKQPAAKVPESKTNSNVSAVSDRVLNGTRQVVLIPVPSFESILALDSTGRLNPTDGEAQHSLFVFTPAQGKYLIRTDKQDAKGKPSCLRIQHNGTASLSVVAASCAANDPSQLFTVTVAKKSASTYAISNQSAFLQMSSQGELIAEELGDAPLKTTFKLGDNGKSTLPSV